MIYTDCIHTEVICTMSDIRELVKKHHAHYEVWPYYLIFEQGHGTPTATTHRIQVGFDIDVYAARTDNELPLDSPQYQLGYAELQKLTEEISHHVDQSCSIEIVPFLSTIVLDTKNDLRSQALLRIRICHWGGLDQPAGPAEEHALQEIERELQARGIRFGQTGLA